MAATIGVGNAILTDSALSFLGLGFPPDVPTWVGCCTTRRTTSSPRRTGRSYPVRSSSSPCCRSTTSGTVCATHSIRDVAHERGGNRASGIVVRQIGMVIDTFVVARVDVDAHVRQLGHGMQHRVAGSFSNRVRLAQRELAISHDLRISHDIVAQPARPSGRRSCAPSRGARRAATTARASPGTRASPRAWSTRAPSASASGGNGRSAVPLLRALA